jgi:hypothetical protein
LFRAAHSHKPPHYSHIVGAGLKVFHPLMSKLKWI